MSTEKIRANIEAVVRVKKVIFPGKSPKLSDVEEYLKNINGKEYYVNETGDLIHIGSKCASEFCGSVYTKGLRGALLKAKANAATIIPELIVNATNRRWVENKSEKHNEDARKGW